MDSQTIKDQVISYIKSLPDDVRLEDIMYHLYVKEKIAQGLKDADEGRLISHEKVKALVEKWLIR